MSAERGQAITRFLAALCMTLVLAACGGSGSPAGTSTKLFKSVMLNGAQVSPAVTTAATGSGFLTVDADSGEITGSINTFGISASAAHIQLGAVGANGASVVDLNQSSPNVWSVVPGATLTAAQIDALRAGTLYVSVQTAANPAGEIRGQIGRQVYYATLIGAQEAPATGSAARGTGVYVFDPDTKTLSGTTTSTLSGNVAHIHTGSPGVAAPVTFPFTGGPVTWTLPAAVLTDAQVTALQSGNLYANVHTTAFPGGEIRGQLYLPAKPTNLSGAQETPPNSSTASGVGSLSVNPFTQEVAGRIETTGITGVAAHAHQAAGGVAGGIVIPMTQTSSGVWTTAAGATISDALLIAFMGGNLYLNVHSTAFPGGEIRGQLVQGQ